MEDNNSPPAYCCFTHSQVMKVDSTHDFEFSVNIFINYLPIKAKVSRDGLPK